MRRRRWRAAQVARNAPRTSPRQTGSPGHSRAWTSRSAAPSSAATTLCQSPGWRLASRHAVPASRVVTMYGHLQPVSNRWPSATCPGVNPCRVWPGATGARGGATPHRDTAARTPGPGTCARSWPGWPVSAVQGGASIGIFSESRWATARPDSAPAGLGQPRTRRGPSSKRLLGQLPGGGWVRLISAPPANFDLG